MTKKAFSEKPVARFAVALAVGVGVAHGARAQEASPTNLGDLLKAENGVSAELASIISKTSPSVSGDSELKSALNAACEVVQVPVCKAPTNGLQNADRLVTFSRQLVLRG